MLPVLAFLLANASQSTRSRLLILLGLFVFGVSYHAITAARTSLVEVLPSFVSLFAVGMALALAHETEAIRGSRPATFLAAGITTGLAASLLRHAGPDVAYQGVGNGVLYQPLMAIAFAFLIAALVLCDEPGPLGRLVRSRLLVHLGLISYGIYLWHDPLVLGALHHGLLTGSFVLNTVAIGAAACACATCSWLLVERRALARKAVPLAPRDDPRAQSLELAMAEG